MTFHTTSLHFESPSTIYPARMISKFFKTISKIIRRVILRQKINRERTSAPVDSQTPEQNFPHRIPSPALVEVARTNTLPEGQGTPPWKRRGLLATQALSGEELKQESSRESASGDRAPQESDSVKFETVNVSLDPQDERKLRGIAYLIDGWENGRFQNNV